MRLEQVGTNMHVLQVRNWRILFSYNTPVAAYNTETGELFRTNKHFSVTTSTHINKFCNIPVTGFKEQTWFDNLMESDS
jgi:hypothetical protein